MNAESHFSKELWILTIFMCEGGNIESKDGVDGAMEDAGKAFNSSVNLTIYAEPTERSNGWLENFAGSASTVFWLSEENPCAKERNYWHYVGGVPEKR